MNSTTTRKPQFPRNADESHRVRKYYPLTEEYGSYRGWVRAWVFTCDCGKKESWETLKDAEKAAIAHVAQS